MPIPQLTAQVLLLCGVALSGIVLARILGRSFALTCVLVGFAFGQLLPWLELDTGVRAGNFADIIFYLLLPPLLFEAGWQLEPKLLRRWLPLILILALAGMLVATAVGAIALYFGIAHADGFPLIAALLTACLLAATDPITVIQQLRSANAPQDLAVVIEGESLFNDAAAVVLFGAILSFALGNEDAGSTAGMILTFAVKFCGGLLCGVLAGAITTLVIRLAPDQASVNLTLVLSAFSAFCASEMLLHVSGVMAVIACALVTRAMLSENAPSAGQEKTPGCALRKVTLPAQALESADDTLSWIGLLCNALLFSLMGLAFEPEMVEQRWLAMVLGILAALIARAAAVYTCLALTRRLRGDVLPWRYAPVLVWGGLRGAVTIALALSLPTDLPYWWTIQSIAFGVVLFNLFFQGPSNALLLNRAIAGRRNNR